MAIATIERDPARDTGTPDLRFRLLQQVCGSPVAGFWRAIDRRSGKACVVRVIDADREQSSRRLGELHRERTLAERIGHPGVLRAEVPTIESERIFQVVDPEPARAVDADSEGGRLALLNLLVAVAAVLAEAHARGVFHGAFSRASCLRAGDGRVLVQGFMGDAASAATVRDGAAADHRAFLEFATEMLRQTGGPPPRLRRYFAQYLSEAAPNPPATAMADLCADLRESLEDTFPWPLAGPAAGATLPVEPPTLTLPVLQPDAKVAAPGSAPAPAPAPAMSVLSPNAGASQPPPPRQAVEGTPPEVAWRPAADVPPAPIASIADGAVRSRRAKRRSTTRQPGALDTEPARADVPVLQQLTASPAPTMARAEAGVAREDEPRGHGGRAWLAALFVLLAVAVALYFSVRSRAPATPATPVVAASDVPSRPDATAVVPAGPPSAGKATTRLPAAVSEGPAKTVAPPKPTAEATRAQTAAVTRGSSAAPAVRTNRLSMPAPKPTMPAADAAAQASPQAVRNRVATLVAGGNRALNALEPGAAAEAFEAALALSPDDRAARDGSQRARRLQGVAALMRDAREAAARGDHGRAVQGYSQSLANDPRNRGLAEALATARRNLGRDATSALLAEGHAALGAGRFEQARDAFERALAADPLAPGAKRAAEQAATAILLRDEAEARRGNPTVAGRD